jgi:hypothetical protein
MSATDNAIALCLLALALVWIEPVLTEIWLTWRRRRFTAGERRERDNR